jgi:uncharacterized protein
LTLYLDTSVLVPLHVTEPNSAAATAWASGTDDPLVVSDLAAGEFAASMARLVRMEALSHDTALAIIDDFDRWCDATVERIETESSDIRVAVRLVRQPFPKLLMPDAIHLASCQRLGLTLVAFDTDLAEIAARLGISCLVPN